MKAATISIKEQKCLVCDLTVTPIGYSKQSSETSGSRKDTKEVLAMAAFVLLIINAK